MGDTVPAPKKPRGFAAMSPERRAELARAGGKAAQAKGTARRFTREEAKAAGYKGGAASARAYAALTPEEKEARKLKSAQTARQTRERKRSAAA